MAEPSILDELEATVAQPAGGYGSIIDELEASSGPSGSILGDLGVVPLNQGAKGYPAGFTRVATTPDQVKGWVSQHAQSVGVDAGLALAVSDHESGLDNKANTLTPKGGVGPMQIISGSAKLLGFMPEASHDERRQALLHNPEVATSLGVQLLQKNIAQAKGDVRKGLRLYRGGTDAEGYAYADAIMKKWRGAAVKVEQPPITMTQDFREFADWYSRRQGEEPPTDWRSGKRTEMQKRIEDEWLAANRHKDQAIAEAMESTGAKGIQTLFDNLDRLRNAVVVPMNEAYLDKAKGLDYAWNRLVDVKRGLTREKVAHFSDVIKADMKRNPQAAMAQIKGMQAIAGLLGSPLMDDEAEALYTSGFGLVGDILLDPLTFAVPLKKAASGKRALLTTHGGKGYGEFIDPILTRAFAEAEPIVAPLRKVKEAVGKHLARYHDIEDFASEAIRDVVGADKARIAAVDTAAREAIIREVAPQYERIGKLAADLGIPVDDLTERLTHLAETQHLDEAFRQRIISPQELAVGKMDDMRHEQQIAAARAKGIDVTPIEGRGYRPIRLTKDGAIGVAAQKQAYGGGTLVQRTVNALRKYDRDVTAALRRDRAAMRREVTATAANLREQAKAAVAAPVMNAESSMYWLRSGVDLLMTSPNPAVRRDMLKLLREFEHDVIAGAKAIPGKATRTPRRPVVTPEQVAAVDDVASSYGREALELRGLQTHMDDLYQRRFDPGVEDQLASMQERAGKLQAAIESSVERVKEFRTGAVRVSNDLPQMEAEARSILDMLDHSLQWRRTDAHAKKAFGAAGKRLDQLIAKNRNQLATQADDIANDLPEILRQEVTERTEALIGTAEDGLRKLEGQIGAALTGTGSKMHSDIGKLFDSFGKDIKGALATLGTKSGGRDIDNMVRTLKGNMLKAVKAQKAPEQIAMAMADMRGRVLADIRRAAPSDMTIADMATVELAQPFTRRRTQSLTIKALNRNWQKRGLVPPGVKAFEDHPALLMKARELEQIKAEGAADMLHYLRDKHGMDPGGFEKLPENDPARLAFEERYHRKIMYLGAGVGWTAVTNDVVTFARGYSARLDPVKLGQLRQSLEAFHTWWKPWTVLTSPATAMRDFFSNKVLNWQDGVWRLDHYMTTLLGMLSGGKLLRPLKTAEGEIPWRQFTQDAMEGGAIGRLNAYAMDWQEHGHELVRGVPYTRGVEGVKDFAGDMSVQLAEIDRRFDAGGLGEKMKAIAQVMPLGDPRNNPYIKLAAKGRGFIDDWDRLTNLLVKRGQGVPKADAMMNARRALMDPALLSDFEKARIRPIMPFLYWERQNMEKQLRYLFTKPHKIQQFGTAKRSLEEYQRETSEPGEGSIEGPWMREYDQNNLSIDMGSDPDHPEVKRMISLAGSIPLSSLAAVNPFDAKASLEEFFKKAALMVSPAIQKTVEAGTVLAGIEAGAGHGVDIYQTITQGRAVPITEGSSRQPFLGVDMHPVVVKALQMVAMFGWLDQANFGDTFGKPGEEPRGAWRTAIDALGLEPATRRRQRDPRIADESEDERFWRAMFGVKFRRMLPIQERNRLMRELEAKLRIKRDKQADDRRLGNTKNAERVQPDIDELQAQMQGVMMRWDRDLQRAGRRK